MEEEGVLFEGKVATDVSPNFEREIKDVIVDTEGILAKTLNGFGQDMLQCSGKSLKLPKPNESSVTLSPAKVLAQDDEKGNYEAQSLAQFVELVQNKVTPFNDADKLKELAKDFDQDVSNWVLQNVDELFKRKLEMDKMAHKCDHMDQIWLPTCQFKSNMTGFLLTSRRIFVLLR